MGVLKEYGVQIQYLMFKSIRFEGLDHVLDADVVLHNGPFRLRDLIKMLLGWSTMQIGCSNKKS